MTLLCLWSKQHQGCTTAFDTLAHCSCLDQKTGKELTWICLAMQFIACWLEGNTQATKQQLLRLLPAIRMPHQQMLQQVKFAQPR